MISKLALAGATALIALSSAAQARDGAPYIGLEVGVIKPEKTKLDYRLNTLNVDNGLIIEHRSGIDTDFLAGYDFGLIRAEGELGYKRANASDLSVSPAILPTTGRPAISGRTTVISAMGNALLDVGVNDGLQLYAGGGAGIARFSHKSDITGPGVPAGTDLRGKDHSFAWQVIAGMRVPVSAAVDLGLKYRYFRSKLSFSDDTSNLTTENVSGRFKSHSLLASVLVNFGAAPAPLPPAPEPVIAPPPPPPPATQTCPDGSVILATDSCPVPPPPPPPPPPAPERG